MPDEHGILLDRGEDIRWEGICAIGLVNSGLGSEAVFIDASGATLLNVTLQKSKTAMLSK